MKNNGTIRMKSNKLVVFQLSYSTVSGSGYDQEGHPSKEGKSCAEYKLKVAYRWGTF